MTIKHCYVILSEAKYLASKGFSWVMQSSSCKEPVLSGVEGGLGGFFPDLVVFYYRVP